MKYYIIAGEASGDLHGSELIKALRMVDANAEIYCWGGDLMQKAGGVLRKHYRELAFMGFAEVIANLRTILRNITLCKKDIDAFQPDAVIFIDYPGFNMRIAKWAKAKKYRTIYYISPQIWAWKENRIHALRRDVDKMFVILPFEKDFYENKHGFKVEFVGHPLLDVISNRPVPDAPTFRKEYGLSDRPIIALLPGSRKQEIRKMLDIMLSVVPNFPQYQFVIAGAPGLEEDFYRQYLTPHVGFVSNRTYDLLALAHAALVTSGTATLETALFNVPEVVCYRGNWISYQIAKRIITLKYISLVNLIMDKPVVTELIQDDLNTARLRQELTRILDENHRQQLFSEYAALRTALGNAGAAVNTANGIFNYLQKSY